MNIHMRAGAPRMTPLVAFAIESLEQRLGGRLVTAQSPDYEDMRKLAHANWDCRPLLIARVANAPDLADVVDFARRHQLEIAVRSGGHSVCGHSAVDNGVVIDLRDLKQLDIDTVNMTAWVGSGLTAGDVTAALDRHKLAIGFGDSAGVGIAGLTLGGGVGYLTRKFGLTIDALIGAEIVTASGSILMIDDENHPDLFWAVRGGGGNFGVVTRFRYKLNALPCFSGGPLVLPANAATLASFVAAARQAPDELTAILMVMKAPPAPFIPTNMVGKTVLMAMMAYVGPEEDANRVLAPFRALAMPIADLVSPGPLSMMYMPEEADQAPNMSVRAAFVDDLDIRGTQKLLDRFERSKAAMQLAQIRVLGGAMKRVPNTATAFGQRDAEILVGFIALDPDPGMQKQNEKWVEAAVADLGGNSRPGYVNFLTQDRGDAVQRAYGKENWQRLMAIKQAYDPSNLFSRNHNIATA